MQGGCQIMIEQFATGPASCLLLLLIVAQSVSIVVLVRLLAVPACLSWYSHNTSDRSYIYLYAYRNIQNIVPKHQQPASSVMHLSIYISTVMTTPVAVNKEMYSLLRGPLMHAA
jgi:hypothetical protein